MVRGRAILAELFPGLEDDLLAAGARPIDMGRDLAWLTPAGWGVRFRSGLEHLPVSRDLLESRVRARLGALARVEFRDDRHVEGLLAEGSTVLGVRLRPASGDRGVTETLRADLVVDASGRGSKAPLWLQEIGFPAPEETLVNTFAGYASRVYRRPAALEGPVRATDRGPRGLLAAYAARISW